MQKRLCLPYGEQAVLTFLSTHFVSQQNGFCKFLANQCSVSSVTSKCFPCLLPILMSNLLSWLCCSLCALVQQHQRRWQWNLIWTIECPFNCDNVEIVAFWTQSCSGCPSSDAEAFSMKNVCPFLPVSIKKQNGKEGATNLKLTTLECTFVSKNCGLWVGSWGPQVWKLAFWNAMLLHFPLNVIKWTDHFRHCTQMSIQN